MLQGEFTPKLDEKGRFFLPTQFRNDEQLKDERLTMVRHPERCLAIWATPTFDQALASLVSREVDDPDSRVYQRLLGSSSLVELDNQGRILIPPALREYAKLDKEIVIIGAVDHLEVWDAQAWATYLAKWEPKFENLGRKRKREVSALDDDDE